jgi:hypothetical protein
MSIQSNNHCKQHGIDNCKHCIQDTGAQGLAIRAFENTDKVKALENGVEIALKKVTDLHTRLLEAEAERDRLQAENEAYKLRIELLDVYKAELDRRTKANEAMRKGLEWIAEDHKGASGAVAKNGYPCRDKARTALDKADKLARGEV